MYAKEHQATVNLFYTSNVDEYLYQDNGKDPFFASLATLPVNSASAIIRTVCGPNDPNRGALHIPAGQWWAALHCSMPAVIQAYRDGKIPRRTDLNGMCKR